MTRKLFCLCTIAALLAVFATTNTASAQTLTTAEATVTAPCDCARAAAPCQFYPPGCPPVTYRVGLFGALRPVVYAPVYRPVYLPPRYVCPPAYIPYRPYVPPYCW